LCELVYSSPQDGHEMGKGTNRKVEIRAQLEV